jgi:hypothetical protein
MGRMAALATPGRRALARLPPFPRLPVSARLPVFGRLPVVARLPVSGRHSLFARGRVTSTGDPSGPASAG